ncbi:MAG: hypothetical protein IJ509_00565 [Bacilli bacterium]|nr:hypothetical protein [Bacilli bacterium]
MKNNIFKNDFSRLIDEELSLNNKWMPIATNYIDLRGNYKFDEATDEDKINMDIITKQLDSNNFRQKCIYDLFPENLGEAPSSLIEYLSDEVQNITIYPDITDKESNKHYLIICEEQIECPETMTSNQYYEIYAKTMKRLLSTGKVTPKMIEETKKDFPNKFATSIKKR